MPAPTALLPSRLHAFTGRDVPWLLSKRAELRADHPFLIWAPFDRPAETWTYVRFSQEVDQLAAGLARDGVGIGDRILIHLDNCPEFMLAWFACSRLGAIAVTTNTRSSAEEVAYFIEHSGAKAAITQPSFASLFQDAGETLAWVAITTSDIGDNIVIGAPGKLRPFESLMGDATALLDRAPDPMLPNSVQYTSGTTSRPKGVVWTHANALFGAKQTATKCRVSESDIAHACLPLYHTNSLCYIMLSTLWAGSTMVVQPRFSASRYWSCFKEHGVTWSTSIPFILRSLMKHPVPEEHSVRFWALGASEIKTAEQTFRVRSLGLFGMTETISLPLMADFEWENREGSMGRPVLDCEIRIVDDSGAEVPFGTSGRLQVRGIPGLTLFLEYLNNEAATAEAFDQNGWFDTGDLATPFADGDIRYDGRSKDMLRIGAENVAASEIERVIGTVPGVNESAVVGKPHELLDEVAVAFVVSPVGEQLRGAIQDACAKGLADFKVPREIHFVEELPRVTLGKTDKKTLRKMLKDGIGETW
jgi:carnitine-CoA ligase